MNKLMEIKIERLANNGKGVGKAPDGKTVFVSGAVPGDLLNVEVTEERARFYEADIREITKPSAFRTAPDCPDTDRCGGCCFRQMTYDCELSAKQEFVRDAFSRIGGFEIPCEPIIPSPQRNAYRNKAEFVFGRDADGKLFAGFSSEKSHRAVPVPECRLIPPEFSGISERFCALLSEKGLSIWDPKTRKGLLRNLVLRRSGLTGEIMLILSAASDGFNGERETAEQIHAEFPQVTSVILNINREPNAPVPGRKNRILSGAGFLRDMICGVPVEIGPLSFFQVNTPAAEALYRTAAEFAAVKNTDTVLDLYCGMGTIGLSMAADCAQLIGGEIVAEAVESARRNAAEMGCRNARFLSGDAAQITDTVIREGIRPDLIILDPPRRGCSPDTLQAVLKLFPERIVMVSCDPATAARDCRILCDRGYTLSRLRPADLFPGTKHVETVCLLTHS